MRRAALACAVALQVMTIAPGLSRAAPPPVSQPNLPAPDLSAIVQGIAAHRATYDLSLEQSNGIVVGASGTMAFEIDDACDGWATRQRLKMTIENRDTQPIEMVSDYATFETKDGKHLNFRMRQTTEQAVTSQIAGDATLDRPGGSGDVHYTAPKDKHMKLPPGTVFPTWHTAEIVAAAEAGKKFIALPLFDGTGTDGAQDSSVVITSWNQPMPAPFPALSELPSGRVHVAFFPTTAGSGLPDYEVGMRYWSNGVADNLRMDFGNFVMAGKLKEFSLQKPHC